MKFSMKKICLFSLLLLVFLSHAEAYILTGSFMLPMTSNITVLYDNEKSRGKKHFFTIPLNIGDPERTFNLQLDTSVTTSWIPSSKCKNCAGATTFYDELKSTTSSPSDIPVELEDEDGDVEGYKITDNVHLGGYKLKQFGFVQVTAIDDPEEFRDHFDGKLGLGYSEGGDHDFNFIQKLKDANLIHKRVFSINEVNSDRGLLFIGDVPGKKYPFCNITNGTFPYSVNEDYKESWICNLTHVGVFKDSDGVRSRLSSYSEAKVDKASFDSAYDFISVPISDRKIIEDLLSDAGLRCRTNENEDRSYKNRKKKESKKENIKENTKENSKENEVGKVNITYKKSANDTQTIFGEMVGSPDFENSTNYSLTNNSLETTNKTESIRLLLSPSKPKKNRKKFRYDEEEISIFCEGSLAEIQDKKEILSFVFQGHAFSVPLAHLFKDSGDGEVEMLVKFMDNRGAIWTLGYPFMNQFLMIFNLDDHHVGFKKLKKTAISVIDLSNQWDIWNKDKEEVVSGISMKLAKNMALILCVILVLVVVFLIFQALRKVLSSEKKDMQALREEAEQPKFRYEDQQY